MHYFGGKQRIAKHLSQFLNSQMEEGQTFIDLFCGSCNVVSNIRQDVKRYANDKNKHLPAMWSCLQEGWMPPSSSLEITSATHNLWKNKECFTKEDMEMKCFIGFGCSFAGVWFGGYTKPTIKIDYVSNAHNSTMKKAEKMKDVGFFSMDYSDFICPEGSLVYCDIPYKGTNQYSAVGNFDHEAFYTWAKAQKNCRILVSEYKHNVPEDATVVWERRSKNGIRNKDGVQEATVEVLFEFNN